MLEYRAVVDTEQHRVVTSGDAAPETWVNGPDRE
jgi:hypothetical protein